MATNLGNKLWVEEIVILWVCRAMEQGAPRTEVIETTVRGWEGGTVAVEGKLEWICGVVKGWGKLSPGNQTSTR